MNESHTRKVVNYTSSLSSMRGLSQGRRRNVEFGTCPTITHIQSLYTLQTTTKSARDVNMINDASPTQIGHCKI